MIWGLSLHGWEDVMRGSLAIVGVFGLLVGLATFFVVTLQREEIATSKDELEEYKLDAGKKIAAADALAERAKADAAIATAAAAEATKQQEELRGKNLALEKSIAPRMIEQALAAENLKPFADIKYAIFFTPDAEARNLAAQINALLNMAGWEKSQNPPEPPRHFIDGVRIHWGPKPPENRANGAAYSLVEQLKASDVAARVGPPVSEFEPDTVRISVGLKPLNIQVPGNLPAVNPVDIPGLKGLRSWGTMLFDNDE
jgi:hypothetical protein